MKKPFSLIATVAAFMTAVLVAPVANAASMQEWQAAVVKKLTTKQKYPRAALSREIEGRAKVRLVVSADGSITNHEIIENTGEDVLDREIPKLLKRMNPLPSLPENKTELAFILPLVWTLD